jgi:hypothetical protein
MPHSSSTIVFLISFRAQHRERIIPKTTTKNEREPVTTRSNKTDDDDEKTPQKSLIRIRDNINQ